MRKLYEAYEQNLKDTEKTVIRLRYGLFGSKEHTQREIAGQLGISRSYVSRLEKRAVDDLVKRLRRKLRQRQGSIRIETVWGYGFRLSSAEE